MICSVLLVRLYTLTVLDFHIILILNRDDKDILQFTHTYHNAYAVIQQELIIFTNLFFEY